MVFLKDYILPELATPKMPRLIQPVKEAERLTQRIVHEFLAAGAPVDVRDFPRVRGIADAMTKARMALSLTPIYRLKARCFLHDTLLDPYLRGVHPADRKSAESYIYWRRRPNEAMQPVNLTARLRHQLYLWCR